MDTTRIEYQANRRAVEGIFTGLLPKLGHQFDFDQVAVHELDLRKKAVLWIRHRGKGILRVTMVRRGARYCFELSNVDPAVGRRMIGICRDHFDAWFGITKEEVAAWEKDRTQFR